MSKETQKKNVVVFIFRSCGYLAGTERWLLNWCKYIDTKKTSVIICTDKGSFWKIFSEEVPSIQIKEYFLDFQCPKIIRFFKAFALFKKMNATKIVWLFNQMGGFSFFDMMAGLLASKGNAFICHNNMPKPFNKILKKTLFAYLSQWFVRRLKLLQLYIIHVLSKKIIAANDEVKCFLQKYLKIPSSKIMPRMTGTDINVFYPKENAKSILTNSLNIPANTTIFFAANRFSEEKRIDRLLGAFLLLLKKRTKVRLIIAGSGKLYDYYKKRIEQNRLLKTNVMLEGHTACISKLYQASDFLLLSSDREGLGNVILEGMACGAIPIVTDSYGPRTIKGRVFISERNVYSYYRKINQVVNISKHALNKIRVDNANIIKKNYNMEKSCSYMLSNIGIPSRSLLKMAQI